MTKLLKEMISDYKNKGSRVDEVLFQEVCKTIERAQNLKVYVDENSMKTAELNVFLQKRNTAGTLGMHVIDAVMNHVQELEATIKAYDHSKDLRAVIAGENVNLKIENQRYKQALEEVKIEAILSRHDSGSRVIAIVDDALKGESE